jgi:hypothetical protein
MDVARGVPRGMHRMCAVSLTRGDRFPSPIGGASCTADSVVADRHGLLWKQKACSLSNRSKLKEEKKTIYTQKKGKETQKTPDWDKIRFHTPAFIWIRFLMTSHQTYFIVWAISSNGGAGLHSLPTISPLERITELICYLVIFTTS